MSSSLSVHLSLYNSVFLLIFFSIIFPLLAFLFDSFYIVTLSISLFVCFSIFILTSLDSFQFYYIFLCFSISFSISLILFIILFSLCLFFFKKWANPGLFFFYFHLFKHTLQFLQQINVKKCTSSIWCRDTNSWPLEHESPPITIRPVHPPSLCLFFIPRLIAPC